MAIRREQGIVLRTYPFGDSHKVVILATPDRGKVRCVAKGVRKTTSRFGGRLEPFTLIQAVLYEGRELDTITQVDVVEAFPRLREDLDAIAIAGVMAEVMDQVLFEDEPSHGLFTLFRRALGAVDRGMRGPDRLSLFFLRIADHLGFNPALDRCAGCDAVGDLKFSIPAGGAVCTNCAPAGALGLTPGLLDHLMSVRDDSANTPLGPHSEAALTLMRRFIEAHLDRRLKSMAGADA